jgi:hypothetical protein
MQRLFLILLVLSFGAGTALAQARPTPLKAGDKIPPFRAMDQAGKERTFRDLAGPKGLVVFFHKSADW